MKVLDISLYASGVVEVRVFADSTIPVRDPHEFVRLIGNILQRPIGLKQVVVLVIPYKEEHTRVNREFWSKVDEMLDWLSDEGFIDIGTSPWTWLNMLCFDEARATSLEDVKVAIDKLKDTFELPDDYLLLLVLSSPPIPDLLLPEQPSATPETPGAENVNKNEDEPTAVGTPGKQPVEEVLKDSVEHSTPDYKTLGVAILVVAAVLAVSFLVPRFILKRHV